MIKLNKIIIFACLLFIFFYLFSKNKNILPINNDFNPINNWYDLYETIYFSFSKNKLLEYKKKIPKYLPKRNLIPIKNKYQIIKSNYDISDFHFVLYYINDNEAILIVRRLDNLFIEKDIYLKIFEYNEEYNKENKVQKNTNFELIKINKIKNNDINILIKTKIKLFKFEINNNQLIPKIIIQTSKNNFCSLAEYNAIMTFIDLNPEYEYMYFDNNDCIEFITKHFDVKTLNAFNNIVPGAYKADLFRCCVLKIIGGCYFDIKQINRTPLREFILPNDNLVLCQDLNLEAYYNAIMCSVSNNNSINLLINNIINNIENKYYGNCPLCPTGPCLLYKVIKNYKPTLFNNCNLILLSNIKLRHKCFVFSKKIKKIICNTSYFGYYERNNKNTYTYLWFNKKIYK